jgi:hypothetical protein
MTELDDLDKTDVNLCTLPHEFETEIHSLVSKNHEITLCGIQQTKDEDIDQIEKAFAGEDDQEIVNSEIRQAEMFFDDLRRAANHMALVSLVTRLHHWTRKFVKQLPLNTNKKRQPKGRSAVIGDMEALGARLGAVPIPIQFFEYLVTARDSVIHGDSQAQWEHGRGARRVADRYINNYGGLCFTEQDLREAIDKATTQVKWYDEQIAALKPSATK